MRRLVFTCMMLACSAAPAAAGELKAEIMAQPDAPVRVVGCSATERTMRDGNNVIDRGSFEVTATKPATAVRIGFAYFDALGGRSIQNGVATGTFSPNVRIDVPPFAGRIGAVSKVVCFAMQATFADGTTWITNALPGFAQQRQPQTPPRETPAPLRTTEAMVPTTILPQEGSPVRFERCAYDGPRLGYAMTRVALTNASDKRVARVDVDFVLYDTAGKHTFHHLTVNGDIAPGAAITGAGRFATSESYAKMYCTAGIVNFADGTKWSAGAGFLKGAVAP